MPPATFEQQLTRYAELLARRFDEAVEQLANEAELSCHVEGVIGEALAQLYDLNFTQIRSERLNPGDKFDTVYGGLVVEYEWQMRTNAHRRHAAKQALDYLDGERE